MSDDDEFYPPDCSCCGEGLIYLPWSCCGDEPNRVTIEFDFGADPVPSRLIEDTPDGPVTIAHGLSYLEGGGFRFVANDVQPDPADDLT